VPGLNAAIKTVVYRAEEEGMEVLGIRRGWAGLLYYDPDLEADQSRLVNRLIKNEIRTIDRYGGTYLHSSRTNPASIKEAEWAKLPAAQGWVDLEGGRRDYTAHVLKVIEHLGIDVLIAIGGDDTLSFAARLDEEGVPVVSIPKTMDNDVYGTDLCIGFPTAITRSVDFITALRTNAGSHERIGIVELFGRNSGETSLIAAYLSGVDRAIISEVPFDVEKLAWLLDEDKANNPSGYAIMTISEGAHLTGGQPVNYGEEDAYGHRKLGGIGLVVSEAIKKLTPHGTMYQQVAYLMRSGAPDALDRMVAISFANLAVELIKKGWTGRMVSIQDGKYTTVPARTPVSGTKRVDVAQLYDPETYRPKVSSMLSKPMFLY